MTVERLLSAFRPGRRPAASIGVLLILAAAAWRYFYLPWSGADSGSLEPFSLDMRFEDLEPLDLEAQVERWTAGKTTVLAADGSPLLQLRLERCTPVAIDTLPPYVIEAFVAAEHPGACAVGNPGTMAPLLEALGQMAELGVDPQDVAERCSAIRAATFGPPPDSSRLLLSLDLGQGLELHDQQALREAYLNLVDLGDGDFGIEAGARAWFGKGASELQPAQAALLAAAATNPGARGNPAALRRARNAILRRLEAGGVLSPRRAALAREAPAPRKRPRSEPASEAPGFLVGVRNELGRYLEDAYARRIGLKVYTSLDPALQASAGKAVEKVLKVWVANREKEAVELSRLLEQIGEEAAELTLEDAPPGSRFEVPEGAPSVSVLAMEPGTGYVRVMLDVCEDEEAAARLREEAKGKKKKKKRSQEPEKVYKVCDAKDIARKGSMFRKRQPGSAFKPFLYATALEQGLGQADSYPDQPFSYRVKKELWSPKNHEEEYMGQITARRALAFSLNSIAVQLMFRVGPERVAELAGRLGIRSKIHPVPALALGTSPVSLGEMVSAYAAFASSGQRTVPHYVVRVEDAEGRPVGWPEFGPGAEVLDPRVAYVLTDMLREVTTSGTAWPAKRLKFPVAGKTGTTNESQDAWFLGFSSRLVAGVWIGFDSREPLGGHETGGSLALPIWMEVMAKAAKASPPSEFAVPEGVVFETRSPWHGKLHPDGKQMAFIAPVRASCVELPPENGLTGAQVELLKAGLELPKKTARQIRAEKALREKRRCDWRPVSGDLVAQGGAE